MWAVSFWRRLQSSHALQRILLLVVCLPVYVYLVYLDWPSGGSVGGSQSSPAIDQAMLEGLMASIAKCWTPPSAGGAERVLVRVQAELDISGRVVSTTVLSPMGPGLSSEATAMIATAEKALSDCQPYDLPEPLYESWRTIIVNFALDPREKS